MLLLYHGSAEIVDSPNLEVCRDNTDFGRGFYTTSNLEQAKKWANIKRDRKGAAIGYISLFELDEKCLDSKDLKVYKFNGANEEWLEFVLNNRRNKSTKFYDIVEGPVADDRLYATITLYEQGILSAKACIEQLETHKLFDQLSFHSSKALKQLKFVKSIECSSNNK